MDLMDRIWAQRLLALTIGFVLGAIWGMVEGVGLLVYLASGR